MTSATLRAALSTGLLLVALATVSASPASALVGTPSVGSTVPPTAVGGWPAPGLGSPGTVHTGADGISSASTSAAQCPCNPDLPRFAAAGKWTSPCPCNAGLPDGPSGALLARAPTTPATPVNQPSPIASAPRGAFDWADAGVGAAATVVIGLLVAGAVTALSRRHWHAGLTAGTRR